VSQLVDSVAEVFSRLGFPSDQIEQIKNSVKGAIKFFLAIMQNVLE
jgi:hypothetical protein